MSWLSGGTPWGTVDTGIQPSRAYSPNTLQIMRNQARAQVPTALGSGFRHTAPGVSTSLGSESDILLRQLAGRMAGEAGVQQAMLGARQADAQQMLAGQSAAAQSGLGLASGALTGLGIGQDYQFGMQQLGLQRQQELLRTLSMLLGLG